MIERTVTISVPKYFSSPLALLGLSLGLSIGDGTPMMGKLPGRNDL